MLGLTGDSARVTTNAHVLVDDKAVLQETLPTLAGFTEGFLADRGIPG